MGKTKRWKLEIIKRVSTSVLFHVKTTWLGMDLFHIQDSNYNGTTADKKTKLEKRKIIWNATKVNAESFIQTGKDHKKWMIVDLKIFFAPLKWKEDGPMPTTKIALWATYRLWMHRPSFYTAEAELTMPAKEYPEVTVLQKQIILDKLRWFNHFLKCVGISNRILCMI